jgi:hypothetical protein
MDGACGMVWEMKMSEGPRHRRKNNIKADLKINRV